MKISVHRLSVHYLSSSTQTLSFHINSAFFSGFFTAMLRNLSIRYLWMAFENFAIRSACLSILPSQLSGAQKWMIVFHLTWERKQKTANMKMHWKEKEELLWMDFCYGACCSHAAICVGRWWKQLPFFRNIFHIVMFHASKFRTKCIKRSLLAGYACAYALLFALSLSLSNRLRIITRIDEATKT